MLVVEDNVSNFVLIARMLGFLGIHCEWKTSGYEVVEYADTLPRLDLILMDIRLPYEDGYGALKKIRQSSHLKNVPVVAVTAEGSQEQINKAKEAGLMVSWGSLWTRIGSQTKFNEFYRVIRCGS